MKQVLYFGAEWCAPCQAIKPYIKQLQGQMSVAMIDADSNSDLIAKWQVRNIPTIVVTNNGVEVNRLVGNSITKNAIINLYNQ